MLPRWYWNYEVLTSLVRNPIHCGKLAKMLFVFCYPPLNNDCVVPASTQREMWTQLSQPCLSQHCTHWLSTNPHTFCVSLTHLTRNSRFYASNHVSHAILPVWSRTQAQLLWKQVALPTRAKCAWGQDNTVGARVWHGRPYLHTYVRTYIRTRMRICTTHCAPTPRKAVPNCTSGAHIATFQCRRGASFQLSHQEQD